MLLGSAAWAQSPTTPAAQRRRRLPSRASIPSISARRRPSSCPTQPTRSCVPRVLLHARRGVERRAAERSARRARRRAALRQQHDDDLGRQSSFFAEQRFVPFFQLEPRILDHWARLRASFEIDFTWGDSAFGTGGNFGGALGARQINLETQNLDVEINLPLPGWYVTVGLQRLVDNPRDPYRTLFSTLAYTGTRLAFWGSDAVGVAVYGRIPRQIFKLGAYDLYENNIAKDDNVCLFEAMTDRDLGRSCTSACQARYVRDTSSGAGGVAVVGQGPGSALPDYMGVLPLPARQRPLPRARRLARALDVSYNPEFTVGRFGGSAFVVVNLGEILSAPTCRCSGDRRRRSRSPTTATIAGVAANARLGYRYGTTRNDRVDAEVMYTSGDGNGIKRRALHRRHHRQHAGAHPPASTSRSGAYLLMPHPNVINRVSTAVFDIVEPGLRPHGGHAQRQLRLRPQRVHRQGRRRRRLLQHRAADGRPLHRRRRQRQPRLSHPPRPHRRAHGAYLHLGDFYDSPSVVVTRRRRGRAIRG